jgi:hypothetical protein
MNGNANSTAKAPADCTDHMVADHDTLWDDNRPTNDRKHGPRISCFLQLDRMWRLYR